MLAVLRSQTIAIDIKIVIIVGSHFVIIKIVTAMRILPSYGERILMATALSRSKRGARMLREHLRIVVS
jgi:hypothetical protein